MKLARLPAIFVVALLAILIACGGGSNSMSSNNNSPNPGSSNPGNTPSSTPDNYFAHMFNFAGRYLVPSGTISVDTNTNNGQGGLVLTAANPTTQFSLQFCQFPQAWKNCVELTKFTSASGGNNVPFTMPKGTWAGAFTVRYPQGDDYVLSGMASSSADLNWRTALLPASGVTGGVSSATGTESGSGSLNFSGTTLQLNLTGAKPNNTYNVQLCSIDNICSAIGSVTSNSQGTVSQSLGTADWEAFVGVVTLSDAAGMEYISAFRAQ